MKGGPKGTLGFCHKAPSTEQYVFPFAENLKHLITASPGSPLYHSSIPLSTNVQVEAIKSFARVFVPLGMLW